MQMTDGLRTPCVFLWSCGRKRRGAMSAFIIFMCEKTEKEGTGRKENAILS